MKPLPWPCHSSPWCSRRGRRGSTWWAPREWHSSLWSFPAGKRILSTVIPVLHVEHRTGYSTSFEPATETTRGSNWHLGYLLSNWNHRYYCASPTTKPCTHLSCFRPCTHSHMAKRRRSGWGSVWLARWYKLCGASSVYTDVSFSNSSLFYSRTDCKTIHGSPSTPSSSPSTSYNCTMCMSSDFLRSSAGRPRSSAFRPCNCTFHSFETQ